jgi:pimeloyl-ACP methyl ester carboxylesterase
VTVGQAELAVTPREHEQIRRAESEDRPAVVLIHGLWMLASSWHAWRERFEAHGYLTLAVDWPEDPDSVPLARDSARAMAVNSIAAVTDHVATVIGMLPGKPFVVGHSFGGLVAQQLAGRGLAAATVAISPAPGRGILRPPPPSALRASWPIVRNPMNRRRAVMLSAKQFRYAFANAVDADEARHLYETHAVPGAGRLVFQAAAANLNPWSQARVDASNPHRGPMAIVCGDADRIVPRSIAHAAFTRQRRNGAATEFIVMPGRGHSLCIDSGWSEVAAATLRFLDGVRTDPRG